MEDNEELESIKRIEEQMEIERVAEIGRVLGYGIPLNIFIDRFNALSSDQKDVLDRVARRLETIKRLSYESLFISNPHLNDFSTLDLRQWKLPSIQIYLYCACIDTLAGPPKYERFEDWLTSQEDLTNLNVGEKHKEYLKTYGIGRNFKKLFTEYLSPNTKNWLNSNIAIQKSTEYEVLLERNQDDFIKHLQGYFYNYWRNPFTHESRDRPVNLFDASYMQLFSDTQKDWVRQPGRFTFDKDSKITWELWHKKGLDIGIISRIIIHSVVFQWLGIEITDELLNKNVYFLHRLHWMYLYIYELRNNTHYLGLWKDIEEEYSHKFLSSLRNSGIFSIGHNASSKLLEFFPTNFEISFREHIQEYIGYITNINKEIHQFNIEHPHLESSMIESPENEKRCKQEIIDFLSKLKKEIAYKEIMKHSQDTWHTWHIWSFIRFNHEYESKDMGR